VGRQRARAWVASALVVATALPAFAPLALADEPSDAGAPPPAAPPPNGIAVLARPGAEDAARALAKEIYARPSLRPAALDEAHARILVGTPAAADASQSLRDLADERASIHGDDGASRALLRTIATQLGVRALVVVEVSDSDAGATPSARVFVAESGAFDAARYESEAPGADRSALRADSPSGWAGTVASLDRTYGLGGPETHAAPALALSPVPPPRPAAPESHPFYTSPWFWGAVGAAAFGGVAVYFATRDNTTDTIHLELQVPK
jgi:hypothetical protein